MMTTLLVILLILAVTGYLGPAVIIVAVPLFVLLILTLFNPEPREP